MEQKIKLEIAKWALLSLLVVVSVFSVRYAVGQSSRPDPFKHMERTIQNVTYTIDRDATNSTNCSITVNVKNDANTSKAFDVKVSLVKTVFKGNPLSRVISPKDMEKETIGTKSFKKELAAAKSWQFKQAFDMPKANGDTNDATRVTYSVEVEANGQLVLGLPILLKQKDLK